MTANDTTLPVVTLAGGTHSIATTSGAAMFSLTGRAANTATDTDPLITSVQLAPITIGLDQPLRHSASGAFLSVSGGATVNVNQVLLLDTALLAATAPLLAVTGPSTLTSASDAINLNQRAKLTATGPVFSINASTVNITGSAFRVAGGSGLTVNGDLLSITNGGTLNITNGGALFVSGGSVVNITGALANFAVGNVFSITNNLCTACLAFSSNVIAVELRNGATASNVTITPSTAVIKGGGAFTLSSPSTAPGGTAVFIVDGPTSKVRIGGL